MFSSWLKTAERVIAGALLVGMISGCAAPAGTPQAADPQASQSRASDPQAGDAEAALVVRPEKPARMTADEAGGFTIAEAVRISPRVRNAYGTALALLERGDLEAGIAALREVVEQAPELTAPHIDLGVAYAKEGDWAAAEASLEHALALTPNHPVAHNELGIVYRKTGRFALARQSYENALAVFEDFHYAQRNLGILCDLFLQDLACALDNYTAYQKAFPNDKDVQMWIADIQNRMGTS